MSRKSTKKGLENRRPREKLGNTWSNVVAGDSLFSSWYTIMEPTPHWVTRVGIYTSCVPLEACGMVPRSPGHVGTRLKRLAEKTNIPEAPGIYELRIQHYWYGSAEVVYIGHSNRNLRKRIGQYCKNGSHKAAWFNRLLTDGFTISMRYRVVHPRDLGPGIKAEDGKEYPDWDRYRTAEELETVYLKNYDYMLNVADNSRSRLELYRFYYKDTEFPPGRVLENGPTLEEIETKTFWWQIQWPILCFFVLCVLHFVLGTYPSWFIFLTMLSVSFFVCSINLAFRYIL